MTNKVCIVIVGPTAVGKTAVSLQLAKEFNTQIISADSRQCYRELDIGVAKPSPAQLESTKHYFINSHSIHDDVNAALFERYAVDAAHTIFSQHNTAIMVGGTGLYVDAFCSGLDEMPVIVPGVRSQVQEGYRAGGLSWLQEQVNENDPGFLNDSELANPHRLMRLLEVKLSTGRSIRTFQTRVRKPRPFSIIRVGLELPRHELYQQINRRVDFMLEQGLLDEVKFLAAFRNLNALNTVGYRELFEYLEGRVSFEEAVRKLKLNTRHYAKRQLTWFKRDETTAWFQPADIKGILNYCTGTTENQEVFNETPC